MAKNKNQEKIQEYKLDSFFVESLKFKNNKLYFGTNIYLNKLVKILNLNSIKVKKQLGLNLKSEDHILDDEQIAEIAISNNIEFEKINDISPENILLKINELIKNNKKWPSNVILKQRTPIITIMGHVDHGKTTLLDVIRNTNLTTKEVGGITQKIGAYQIKWKNQKMTFIDTPGHEAFTEMRANGSKVTDIAIIVVSATDSLMKQTFESIDHAKAANLPMIIVINKIDVPGHKASKIINELAAYGVLVEELGGTIPVVEISALKNKNIDKLLDVIALSSELLDLKVPLNVLATGTVIESNIHKTRGNLVTVIVRNGTLRVGDDLILDDKLIRVKSLKDENQELIFEAEPGQPVEIYGAGFSPIPGSNFVAVKDLKLANKIVDIIHNSKLNALRNKKIIREDLFKQLADQQKNVFNIILKTDSVSSMRAIESQLLSMSNNDIEVKIIRKDIGAVTNADIILADASKAIIYQFNLQTPSKLLSLIKLRNVLILRFDIIYKLFDDVSEKISKKDAKVPIKKIIGNGIVIRKFVFSKVGSIAGTKITDGFLKRNSKVNIYRNDELLIETEVKTLRIEKDNVPEVKKGKECGVTFKNFDNFLEGDKLEFFEMDNG